MVSNDKKRNTEIAQADKRDRDSAVTIVKSWADQILRDFHPPARSGVPKGEPIGFSLEKKKAALLMVLHPNGFQLKEIGQLAGGVSENVLRVWRTQKDFQEEMDKGAASFATQLINTVALNFMKIRGTKFRENEENTDKLARGWPAWKFKSGDSPENVLGLLGNALRFFNPVITARFLSWLQQWLGKGHEDFDALYYVFRRSQVKDTKALQKLERNPKILDLNKKIISALIDHLSNPENWKREGDDKMQKYREILKQLVFEKLDILAG